MNRWLGVIASTIALASPLDASELRVKWTPLSRPF